MTLAHGLLLAALGLVGYHQALACENSGSACLKSCRGVANGDYQSCTTCHGFISCSNSMTYNMPCPSGLVWDDKIKRCEYRSSTCVCDDAPIDGQWSIWGPKSKCLTSCDGGLSFRGRECDNPAPQNGGRDCVGDSFEYTTCSDWPCPDCSRQCPQGGVLNGECSLCMCSGDVVDGKVTDASTSGNLSGVSIYVVGREWSSMKVTSTNGRFRISNVCRSGMQLKAVKDGYKSVTQNVAATGTVSFVLVAE